jgi:hypothetical protein
MTAANFTEITSVTALTLDDLAALVETDWSIGMDESAPLLLELVRHHGDTWRITRSVSPSGWIAVQHAAVTAQLVLLACSLTELSEKLSSHEEVRESPVGDALPPGFVRAVLNDAKYTDMLMDALEVRVIALEEVAAARGIGRLTTAWRLARSLRASVRHFPGRSFRERRIDAASTEWVSS